MTSAEVLRQAEKLGLDAHSPLARLDDDDVRQLTSSLQGRAKEDLVREQATRHAQLETKRATAQQRQSDQLKSEGEALAANIARARKTELAVKGLQPAVDPAPMPAVEPFAATPESATPAAAPASPEPAAIQTPTPTPAHAVAHQTSTVAATPPVAVTPAAAVRTPAAATTTPTAESAAAAAAKAKGRPKSPRRPGSEEEIDPDEALVAAYVGPQAIRPATSGKVIERVRTKDADTSPRGRPPMPSRMPPSRMSSSRMPPPSRGGSAPRFVNAAAPAAAPVAAAPAAAPERVLYVRGPVVVKELAEMLGLRPNRLIADLMQLNVLASINQRVEIDLANRIAAKYGYTVELERARRSTERKPVLKRDDADDAIPDDAPENLVPRPPVVTFLGHVDHGKTSLMDRIRNTTVAAGEAGGITQHIGAYTVEINGRKITFLDTPGHAAFSSMRARGASLTDIAVIIIAGDDGIMPQTKEAIRHAKQAGVQILIAINKCDLPQAKPERVKQQLQAEGLTPEDWGGDVVCCEVSATTGKGVDHLLEMILLQADVLELAANPNRRADGFVVEAELEQGRGPTATLLVAGGTLKVGDIILCGDYFGRVRALMDDRGRMVKSATPAIAVKCMGLSGVPEAGAPFRVMLNEKRARDLAESIAGDRKRSELTTSKVTSLDALMTKIKEQSRLELNVIIKGDTQGSVEAIVDSLKEIKSEKVSLNIISSNIGNVTANDIRAAGGGALIIGFQVACEAGVQSLARHDGVRVRTFRIIYELLDTVKQEMLDLLAPEYREIVRGHAMLKTVFDLSRKGKVAGCQVTDGVVRTDCKIRVFRQREVVYSGRLASLRHFQNEVAEVKEPQECGMRFENFENFNENDYIECYALEELPRSL